MKTVVGIAIVGAMTLAALPAEAASIAGKTFSFYGSAKLLSDTAATTTLDFLPSYSNPNADGQASVAQVSEIGSYNQQFTLSDIPLAKTATGWSLTGGALNWIKADAGLGFQYTLTAFDLTKTLTGFEAMVDGIFTNTSPNEVINTVDGFFSSQKKLASLKGTSFSADLTAGTTSVPTPALLPGLIGLGLSVARKRKAVDC
ncbi:MAG: PTPA-CTERM sorting domain-containing protein [Alkalinema sp. RU_4_3]|nr:PTPA-CTERM sorting domain-containing protein [Alkalinema sp. RU_4_3]